MSEQPAPVGEKRSQIDATERKARRMSNEPNKVDAAQSADDPQVETGEVSDDDLDDVAGGVWRPGHQPYYPSSGKMHIMEE